MRSKLTAAAVMLLGLVASACAHSRPAMAASSRAGGYDVNFSLDPALVSQVNRIEVSIRQSDGSVLTSADVNVVLDMPAMPMGARPQPLVEQSPGTYKASGVRFPMSGTWVAKVSIRSSGRAAAETAIRFSVRD